MNKKFKEFSKLSEMSFFEASQLKEQYDEKVQDCNDFLMETYFKRELVQQMNILIRNSSEVSGVMVRGMVRGFFV